ncbi:PilZ domain-containing protein [Chondromyces crocatus]|uniref:PilZ domain-containing protein n=1 Tax=Chondromyces crocatus TaxID=52 RepID=A0A0K1EL22_CHOCO|nr:PilZ domain-containing protein [Chondromyces crocatus]AKT41555.1 uncharacterized protein CMC5_057620 [Chondromyces crocatus]
MSGRGERLGDAGERRGGAGRRVHFEALVAVGEAAGGAGFEAESVDVSPDGMRLRAAYLPEVGERLLCRFDGPQGEIAVEAEVCWRRDEARGGEFGLRFAGLDPASSDAVRALVKGLGGTTMGRASEATRSTVPCTPEPSQPADPARGTRVRLHIEGLGSPMKARVREGRAGEVEVGSNLEFLKVGRTLDLEDMEHGARREAFVDDVRVEVDAGSSVPQLVVTLRYDPPAQAARPAQATKGSAPAAARAASAAAATAAAVAAEPVAVAPARQPRATKVNVAPQPAPEETASSQPGPASAGPVSDREDEATSSPAAEARASRQSEAEEEKGEEPALDSEASPAAEAAAQDGVETNSPPPGEAEAGAASDRGAGLRGVGEKAAAVGRAVAGRVGPALSGASERARGAMSGILTRIRERRSEREAGQGKAPTARRMTAPPPAGALRADGRRLVRDEGAEGAGEGAASAEAEARPRVNKKAAALGSFLGLAAVLVVFGVARLIGLRGGEAPQTTAALPPAATETASQAGLGALPPPAGGGTLTANVPLFGATPLSTTEPVLPSAPPTAEQGRGAPDALAAAGEAEEGVTGDQGDEEEPSLADGGKAWGQGEVRNPIVLKLKMDGSIDRLSGAAGPMGFTVSLPDRRALSSGNGLARKDKRIASLLVVNTPQGAEVSLRFKDGVPPYVAKASGDRLEISLGNESAPKKVAAKSKAKSKKAKSDTKKKSTKGKSN